MNQIVRHYLIELARKRSNQIVNYQKLSDDCKLELTMSNPDHRNQIAKILEDISIFENNNDRPLLSSLVLRLSDAKEGNGFYKLGEQLGFGNWQKLKKEGFFEVEQIGQCIDFWLKENNYLKYK